LERTTFRDPEVAELSRSMVTVRVDLTKSGVPDLEKLSKDLKIASLPTIVFLDREGNEKKELRISDYVKPRELLENMRAAIQ
jgi:thiol:disulfide interchange protein